MKSLYKDLAKRRESTLNGHTGIFLKLPECTVSSHSQDGMRLLTTETMTAFVA
jgi:hypothetical protein